MTKRVSKAPKYFIFAFYIIIHVYFMILFLEWFIYLFFILFCTITFISKKIQCKMWLNLDLIGFDWDETLCYFAHPCSLQNSHFRAELSHYEEKMTTDAHNTGDIW